MTITPVNFRSDSSGKTRVAVVGSGISGASCAWALSSSCDVTLFEASSVPGGHTATVDIDYDGKPIAVDTGFIVYNELNYPDLTALFAHLDVETQPSNMGFSLSLDGGRREWCGGSLGAVFAQRTNFLSPSFLWMLREVLRFNRQCLADRDAGLLAGKTIGEYLDFRKFAASFRDDYLIPMAAAIWSTPRLRILDFPASTFVTFFDNHRLIHRDRPQWRTVTGGSRRYLEKLLEPLGDSLRLGSVVTGVTRDTLGVVVSARQRPSSRFDELVVATHSDQALALLADRSHAECTVLSSIGYRQNRVVLHRDPRLMPKRRAAWSAWNYMRSSNLELEQEVSVTYWMNRLQGIDPALPLFISLNPVIEPREELIFGEWTYSHPQFDARALSAQSRLSEIQGTRRTRFAGAWTGHGFHEDGLRSGLAAATALGAVVPWRDADEAALPAVLAAE